MPHQELQEYNPEYWAKEHEDKNDEEMDELGIQEYLPADLSTWKVLKEWSFVHHGGSGQDWRQDGKIVIYDNGIDETYLEASIKDLPFFSVLSALDQWGTWHTLKLTGVRKKISKDEEVLYAQEWGNPSFLESLGEALIYMAHHTEPDPELYNMPYDERTEKGISPWRREE